MFLATQLQNLVFKVGVDFVEVAHARHSSKAILTLLSLNRNIELRPWFLPSVDLNHISGCDECWGCGVKARF